MEILVPIFVIGFICSTIFGVVYIGATARNKERMALIERGADPKLFESASPVKTSSNPTLKWGFLLVGVGLGIFFANISVSSGFLSEESAYPAMICLFGGLGLLTANTRQQKADQKNKSIE